MHFLAGSWTTYTDSDLSTHDTDDLKVGDCSKPIDIASAILGLAAPAALPTIGFGKVTAQVADGEQDIALETETSTGKNSIVPVPAKWAQRVLLHHPANLAKFLFGFGIVDLGDEGDSLFEWQIGPVDAFGCIAVVRLGEVAENLTLLLGGHPIVSGKLICLVASSRAMRNGDLADDGVVVPLVFQVFRHGEWLGSFTISWVADDCEVSDTTKEL